MKKEKTQEEEFEGEEVLSIKRSDEKLIFWKPKKVGESVEGILTSISQGRFGKVLKLSSKKGVVAVNVNAFLEDIDFTQYADERLKFVYKGVIGKRDCRVFDVVLLRSKSKDEVPF